MARIPLEPLTTLDDTNLVAVHETELQAFAEGVDHAILKDRGTGVASSYVSSVAVGGTTFSQPEVHGEINSDQGFFHITYPGATDITVTNLNSISTYVYIDTTSTLQQQTTIPTRQDWSRKMFTMRISVDPSTNLIVAFEYLNNPEGHYTNSMRDIYSFLLAQGVPFKKDQVITGRADLGFDVSAGSLLEFGGTGDIHNANIKSFDAVVNVNYYLFTRTGILPNTYTDLVKFWDNNSVMTAIGSTTWVGHRLYRFSSGNFAMQYGQGNYANLTLAKAGVLIEPYEKNPRLVNATFFGWWFIESTATTTNGATADFVPYTLGIQGGSSSAIDSALLKGNNLSDLPDAVAALTNIGALSKANNLSDLQDAATAMTNIGALSKANNLSDLQDVATAMTNLGAVSKGTIPSSASDTGTTGQIASDTNYIYVCTATNTWKRTTITTWS